MWYAAMSHTGEPTIARICCSWVFDAVPVSCSSRLGALMLVSSCGGFESSVPGAGASFHGGGLVTDKPDSPHLLAPKIRAKLYIAIAGSDDMRQPEAKDQLRDAFAAAKVPAEIEVYSRAQHGWCVPDMPLQANGDPTYSKPDAERAWRKLLALYHSAL